MIPCAASLHVRLPRSTRQRGAPALRSAAFQDSELRNRKATDQVLLVIEVEDSVELQRSWEYRSPDACSTDQPRSQVPPCAVDPSKGYLTHEPARWASYLPQGLLLDADAPRRVTGPGQSPVIANVVIQRARTALHGRSATVGLFPDAWQQSEAILRAAERRMQQCFFSNAFPRRFERECTSAHRLH